MSCVSILQGPSNLCTSKTIFRELSPEAKAAILDRHNQLRRRVASGQETGGVNGPQPQASNMKKMVGVLCTTQTRTYITLLIQVVYQIIYITIIYLYYYHILYVREVFKNSSSIE